MSSPSGKEESTGMLLDNLTPKECFMLNDPFQDLERLKDPHFLEEVIAKSKKDGISSKEALRGLRVDYLIQEFKSGNPGGHPRDNPENLHLLTTEVQDGYRYHIPEFQKGDFLVHLLTEVHDGYYQEYYKDETGNRQKGFHYPNFVQELTDLVIYILEKDYGNDKKYSSFIIDEPRRTLLHLAAERALSQIIMHLVQLYPSLVYITMPGNYDELLPVEMLFGLMYSRNASYLVREVDESASFLIKRMQSYRIKSLFEESDYFLQRYNIRSLIECGFYKKTCIAILDCMIDVQGSLSKQYEKILQTDNENRSWFAANVPVSCRFDYDILENDIHGHLPDNSEFNHDSTPVLQYLVANVKNKELTTHPVVQSFVGKKWCKYGKYITMGHVSLYILFLVVLSIALLTQPVYRKSTTYEGSVDILRAFCEVCALIFAFCFFISEMKQLHRKKCKKYFSDITNYFDLFGIFSILLTIPLRYTNNHDFELVIAGIGFAIYFTRLLKFFPASETLGIYMETIRNIVMMDITKFFVVFSIVMFGYVGMVYLVLKGLGDLHLVGGFWKIFFKVIRALVEGKEFADPYDDYHLLAIVVLMVVMAAIIVVMLNLLIGQISYRYEQAQTSASINHYFNRCALLVKAEKSMLLRYCFKSLKRKAYQRSAIEDGDKVKGLISAWLKVKKKYNDEESQKAINDFLVHDVMKIEMKK